MPSRTLAARAALGLALLAATARAQVVPPEVGQPTPADSTRKIILWDQVTPLAAERERVTDATFVGTGLNIVNPGEIVWMSQAGHTGLVAAASRPIPGTAEAGEEMGRRAEALLPHPLAVCGAPAGLAATDAGGLVVVLRSGWTDSLQLPPAKAPGLDLALGSSGLLYVLAAREVLVYGQPPQAPLWTFGLEADLLPPVGMAVNMRGEIFVAGQGKEALAVYEVGPEGRFRRTRGAAAAALGVAKVAGLAVTPPMLLPIPGREGWVGEGRFVVLSDSAGCALVTLDARDLHPVGRQALHADLPGIVPGRIDVSNRGQIACVNARGGGAWALPTRVLAGMVRGVPDLRWRIIPSDTTGAVSGPSGP